MTAPPRIVIAAGGTAGHVVPAIAVADALRAEGAEVSFVGGERAEAELVPAAGYPLDRIRVEGISRTNPLKAARAVSAGGAGAARARRILERAPGRRGARRRRLRGRPRRRSPPSPARIPLVLTEADSHLGLTNRLLAPRARRVCLAFPLAGPRRRALPRDRPARAAARDDDRAAAPETRRHRRGRAPRARLRGLARRPHDQPRRDRGLRRTRRYRVLHVAGRRDSARADRARPALRPARLPRRRSASRWPPPTSRSRAPAARSSSSPSTACRPSWSPIRTPRATTRRPTRAGCSDAGAAVVIAGRAS